MVVEFKITCQAHRYRKFKTTKNRKEGIPFEALHSHTLLRQAYSHSRLLCAKGKMWGNCPICYSIQNTLTLKKPYWEENNQWSCLQLLSIDFISRYKLRVTHIRWMTTTYKVVSVVVVIEITSTSKHSDWDTSYMWKVTWIYNRWSNGNQTNLRFDLQTFTIFDGDTNKYVVRPWTN